MRGEPGLRREPVGHGERSRSELHFKLAGTGNMLILAVNGLAVNDLAVNGALPLHIVSKGVLDALYSVKKCLRHYIVAKSGALSQ